MRNGCAIYTRRVNWSGIRMCVATLVLTLHTGGAVSASACLTACAFATEPKSAAAVSQDHCNSEPSIGAGDSACHSNIAVADAALRTEWRLIDAGAVIEVASSPFKMPASRADAGDADTARAAHGPPGRFFPLRV